MTESASRDPASSESDQPGAPTPRAEPTFLETMKWAGVMLGITGLIAAITIPVLLWLDWMG